MKKLLITTALLQVAFSSFYADDSAAWNENTHKLFSEYAATSSVLSKDKGDYMQNLGFNKDLLEEFKWNEIKRPAQIWIAEGAYFEDAGSTAQGIAGTARYVNHFHNPLKPWISAGLDDWVGLHYTGESSLLWSQDTVQQSVWMGGDWSWRAIRLFFYDALTQSTDIARQASFAQTFKGLGHQMHLIQDAGQPDHVRNDAHPADGGGWTEGLETWTKNRFLTVNDLKTFVSTPLMPTIFTNPSAYLLDSSYFSMNLTPAALFIDTDQYTGSNPSASFSQGLAEYTNANFFSDDTIFSAEIYAADNRHYFPYPKKTSTNIQSHIDQNELPETLISEDLVSDRTFYIKKIADGEIVDHFVKPSYFSNPIVDQLGDNDALYHRTFYRDDKCHEDYAKLLLPRAVGYSAALLNYFFRGSIDITLPDSGMYSSATPTDSGFTTFKVMAKNTTANGEKMLDGSIELVVKYRLALEDTFKTHPADYYIQVEPDFSYIVASEKNGVREIPSDHPVELTFDLSNPLPLRAIEVYLQVVYNGKLGNEDGSVAVGFKDISEPTPVDLFNNMDKICLNGNWYDAGSQAAIDQVPGWDVFVHDIQGGYLKITPYINPAYASPSNYTFSLETLEAGNLYRGYVLSDYGFSFHYSEYAPAVPKNTDEDTFDHSNAILTGIRAGSAIKNQIDYQVADEATCAEIGRTAPCDVWYYPLFYSFRGYEIWGSAGFIIDNPKYPTDTDCDWQLLN